MKKMSKKILMATILVVMLVSCTIFAVGCKKPNPPAPTAPIITVDKTELVTKSFESIQLPSATATDEKDADIASKVCLRVYFDEDGEYVFPVKGKEDGVSAVEQTAFTPDKIGRYKIEYFVTNSSNLSTVETVNLSVIYNDAARGQNEIKSAEDWVFGPQTSFNDNNEVEIAGPAAGDALTYSSVAYKGKKVQNGDVVSIRFSAENFANESRFYSITYALTENYDQTVPGASEGVWPDYMVLRILNNSVESYFSLEGNKSYPMFKNLGFKLLDGKDHILSFELNASGDSAAGTGKLETKIWIDKALTLPPDETSEVKQFELDDLYGEGGYNTDLVSSDIGGWLCFGSDRMSKEATGSMRIKSLTFNSEAMIAAPKLEASKPTTMYLSQETVFAAPTARDMNDYNDISDRVVMTIKAPDGEVTTLTNSRSFTPKAIGKYILKYAVKDSSGNTQALNYEVFCAKEESTVAPIITFENEDELTFTVAIGENFVLPTLKSVEDSFGTDLMDYLDIKVTTIEKMTLNGLSKIKFYAAGRHIIEYTVKDFNENTATRKITVDVDGLATGNLIENQSDWFLQNANFVNGNIKIGPEGVYVYKGQRIYSEKVSMLVNFTVASGFDTKDGHDIISFNLRGGKGKNAIPGNAGANDFAWPNGLNLEVNAADGIGIYADNHVTRLAEALDSQKIIAAINKKDAVISYQVTDIYKDSAFVGIEIKVWVNEEQVKFSGPYRDANNNILLPSRFLSLYPGFMDAGWLSVFSRVSDTTNGTFSLVKAVTIDGTQPKVLTYTLDKSQAQSVQLNSDYTLPVISAHYGLEDITSQIKTFIWINGTPKPNFETDTPFDAAILTATESYMSGFKVIYCFENKEVATVDVAVTAAEISVVFEDGVPSDLTAQTGKCTIIPKLSSATIGGSIKTEGFSYHIVYADQKGFDLVIDDTQTSFVPKLSGNFAIEYYFGTIKLTTLEYTATAFESNVVKETAGWKGFNNTGTTIQNGFLYYEDLQIYNSEVTVIGKLNLTNIIDFPLRKVAGQATNNYNWPVGLRLRLAPNEVKICVGINGDVELAQTTLSQYFIAATERDIIVSYTIQNIYDENNAVTAIQIIVYINGQKVMFDTRSCSDAQGNCTIPASAFLEGFLEPTNVYFFVDLVRGANFELTGLYFGGSNDTPLGFKITGAQPSTAQIDEDVTLPEFKVIKKQSISSEGVEIFVGTEKINGLTTRFSAAGSYTISYKYGGKQYHSFVIIVASSDEVLEINLIGDNFAATIATEYTLPLFTATLGGVDVISDISVFVRLNGHDYAMTGTQYTPTLNKDFTLVYKYNGEEVLTQKVTVTGGHEGNLISDDFKIEITGEAVKHYPSEQVYDNKISLKYTLAGNSSIFDIGIRGNSANSAWPNTLRLRFTGNGFGMCHLINGTYLSQIQADGLAKYFGSQEDYINGTHVLTFQATDIFEAGAFKGILVKVWINGQRVSWLPDPCVNANGDFYVAENNAVFSTEDNASSSWLSPYYFYISTHIGANNTFSVSELYIDGTSIGSNYDIASLMTVTTNNEKAYVYADEKIKDNIVSAKFTIDALSGVIDFGISGDYTAVSWPAGLRIRIAENELKICSGIGGEIVYAKIESSDFGSYFKNGVVGTHTLTYVVKNVSGGIQVKLWIDSKSVVFTGGTHMTEGVCFIPDSLASEIGGEGRLYIFVQLPVVSNFVLQNLYIDGTLATLEI